MSGESIGRGLEICMIDINSADRVVKVDRSKVGRHG